MKSALLTLALLACATAHAATLTELRPAGPTAGAYRWQCVATGFADAVTGVCQEKYYSAARYAQPRVVGTWVASWDLDGNPTLTTTVTAWPGCYGTQSVVEVNGGAYYYIAADSLGDELVEAYCVSYLVTP